jgi:hypothetical protein
MSPKVEPKRQKLNLSRNSGHTESYSRAVTSSAAAPIPVAITSARREHITSQAARKVEEFLKRRVVEQALENDDSAIGPCLAGRSQYANGALRLVCKNEHIT